MKEPESTLDEIPIKPQLTIRKWYNENLRHSEKLVYYYYTVWISKVQCSLLSGSVFLYSVTERYENDGLGEITD